MVKNSLSEGIVSFVSKERDATSLLVERVAEDGRFN